jgi:hypothetical protein
MGAVKVPGLSLAVTVLIAEAFAGWGGCAHAASPPTLNPSVVNKARGLWLYHLRQWVELPAQHCQLSDGWFLVSTSDPVGAGGVYNSTGTIRRFVGTITPGASELSRQSYELNLGLRSPTAAENSVVT